MRILLDTQVWLWMVAEPERLSARARDVVVDRSNELLLSAASAWEIGIKHAIGQLEITGEPSALIPVWMGGSGVRPLAIDHGHARHGSA